MATSKNSTKPEVPYTEQQVLARRATAQFSDDPHRIHCLNQAGHKNDDQSASAYYYPRSQWYGCHGCDMKGFVADHAPYTEREHAYTYSNGTKVHRKPDRGKGKVIWQSDVSKDLAEPMGYEDIDSGTKRVVVVEGEKCYDALAPCLREKYGSRAVCLTSIGGSNAAARTNWE